MIHDSAKVKFVNKKFILSTNNKANPVQIVRQKEAGNDHDVIIHLSDGTQFDDKIENFKDLVGLTSNKLYGFSFELRVNFSKESRTIKYIDQGKYVDDYDGLIALELSKFEETLLELMTYSYQFSELFSECDSIVKPEERVWLTTVSAVSNNFMLPYVKKDSYGDELSHVYGDFSIRYHGLVLCPDEAIEDFLKQSEDDGQAYYRRLKPPARICERYMIGHGAQLVEKTVADFFTADFDKCDFRVTISTAGQDKKYFEKKFTSDDEYDIVSMFDKDLNSQS